MFDGTLAAHDIRSLITAGHLIVPEPDQETRIQPASLDLVLSSEAWRMPGSTLPRGDETIRELIDDLAIEALDLSQPCCLARGQIYLVRLEEQLALPAGVEAYANSKSSTGRIDLATRVLADGSARYDRIASGYHGAIWVELIPRSFDVILTAGLSLNQAIFFEGRIVLNHDELRTEHARSPLLFDSSGTALPGSAAIADHHLVMRADLSQDIVGYVARRCHRPIDLRQLGSHDPAAYFTPIARPSAGYLFLEKDRFYILATRERVAVPPQLACEMVPYDPGAGEFRAHYAGFFDPGFGIHAQGPAGTPAVLEVRPHEDDLILRDGQPICAMAYELLSSPCQDLYGHRPGNHYAHQSGPRLSKYFRA